VDFLLLEGVGSIKVQPLAGLGTGKALGAAPQFSEEYLYLLVLGFFGLDDRPLHIFGLHGQIVPFLHPNLIQG
jgi:hypothetical protein